MGYNAIDKYKIFQKNMVAEELTEHCITPITVDDLREDGDLLYEQLIAAGKTNGSLNAVSIFVYDRGGLLSAHRRQGLGKWALTDASPMMRYVTVTKRLSGLGKIVEVLLEVVGLKHCNFN